MADYASNLAALRTNPAGLALLKRGIEKESLRISRDGNLAQTPHPSTLGSPLTHPQITTDFSEAQLELITGVHGSPNDCLAELEDVHAYVHSQLEDEYMWPASMPCLVGDDASIPIGQYGSSHIGQAKTIYRRGLGVRYGRLMQTISGIHYNFSVPAELWSALGIQSQAEITEAYFGLIRNFRRWSWLLIYALGASPAVCRSFTRNLPHNLQALDEGTMHLPHATSLRMGPLGYQSQAQASLHISYNSVEEYAESMVGALTTIYPPYAATGVFDESGEYQQLNTHLLQIENEFYGTIRPKRTIASGERPVNALLQRGVEYVEVRCLDLNPFEPLGIGLEQIRFIDTFLLLCLLEDSPNDSEVESGRLLLNQKAVVERGREPGLQLTCPQGQQTTLQTWATELLEKCQEIAGMLDQVHDTSSYQAACQAQMDKVTDPEQTPSAQIIAAIKESRRPFFRIAMDQAELFSKQFQEHPLDAEKSAAFAQRSTESLQRQAEIEAADTEPFPEFLQKYLAI